MIGHYEVYKLLITPLTQLITLPTEYKTKYMQKHKPKF